MQKNRIIALLAAVLLLISGTLPLFPAVASAETRVYLSDLTPTAVTTGWGEAHYDENLEGAALSLANAGNRQSYAKGICIHAESSISFDISSYGLPLFTAVVGMDDGSYGYKEYAGASFEVWVDGVKCADYGTRRLNDAALEISVALPTDARVLTLVNGHGDDGSTWSEHCSWCDACLSASPDAIGEVRASVDRAVLSVGETAQITFDAFSIGGDPIDASTLDVTYFSSSPGVASVDAQGRITSLSEGNASVTVTAVKGGGSSQATVGVTCVSPSSGSSFLLTSPGGALQILLQNDGGRLFYSVYKNGVCAVEPSPVGHLTEEVDLTCGFSFLSESAVSEVHETYKNYSGSQDYGHDDHTARSVTFVKDAYTYTVSMRAYDDGYALRSTLGALDGSSVCLTVTDDKTAVKFPAGTRLWGSQIAKKDILKGNSYETGYPEIRMESAAGKYILKAPIASVGDGLWALISEADLYGEDVYIGSIFKGIGDNTLELTAAPQKTTEDGVTTNAILDAALDDELNERLAAIERVRVTASPTFTFPWRYGTVGTLSEIVESDLTDNLNPPAEGDFSWVEPGFTAWMWLSEGFSGQRNEQTIREYIDLASSLGWKYLILDEGWQPGSSVPGKSYDGYFDYFDDLLDYAAEKGVGLIAWVKLYDLNTPEKREILTEWAEKGIKGIKFDFVESEGIDRIENVREIYKKCAEAHLLVNEHGGNVPTGERHTWPNVINRESVKGQEYGGVWCTDTTVMPYTRSAIGPTDITPKLEQTGSNTASHQLALLTVLESGLPCMASDTEVYYASNAKYALSHLPVFFDGIRFIDGYPAEHTVLARRKDGNWYVGGITKNAKSVTFTLDMLDDGKDYTAILYRDGSSRDEIAVETFTARRGDGVTVPMLAGGGFTLMLLPEESFTAAQSLTPGARVITLENGGQAALTFDVLPEDADKTELSFICDAPGVARVNAAGMVTAVGEGVAHVTASLPTAGLSATVEIRVRSPRNYELSGDWTAVNKSASDPLRAGGDEYSLFMPVLTGDTTGTPQNLLLRNAPEGDFTLTVKVSGGLTNDYDSIGLIAYGGSGNMVVMTRRHHTYLGGNVFCLSTYNGGYIEKCASDGEWNADAWLKLEKRGSVFTGYYSYDGVNYTAIPETVDAAPVSNAAGLRIGVCGIHGNLGVGTLYTGELCDFTLDGVKIPFCRAAADGVIKVRAGTAKQLVPQILRTEDDFGDLTFTVDDNSVATVDGAGLLTARRVGITSLTVCNAKTGAREEYEVRVYTLADEGYGEFIIVNPQSGKMPSADESAPYSLTMKTLTGDINGLPKNLVLTGAPSGDFTVTVRVSGGLSKDFQSIGLVAFAGEGRMVTMERRSHSYFGGNVFCASTSISGSYTENRSSDAQPTAEAWLKLVKTGNLFKGYFSFDGSSWTAVTPITNEEVGSSGDLQIGLIARTGMPVAEIDATYSDFTLNGRRIPFVAKEELVTLFMPDDMTVQVGSPLPELPDTLTGYYNSGSIAQVGVVWDVSAFDAGTPGVYTLTAEADGISGECRVTVEGASFPWGDIDGSGEVTIGDVSALLDILSGVGVYTGASADVNKNGVTSIADVSALLDQLSAAA